MTVKKNILPRSLLFFLFISTVLFNGCTLLSLPKPRIPVASKVYDSKHRLITTLYRENRVEVSIEQIPEITQNAFIAVEDARFYQHFGIDPLRIAAAAWNNLKAGAIVQGASTITQQTAKNLYLTRQKTIGRKIMEAWLAIQLERNYTKRQILEMYLNQIYFGQGAYGIETAAQSYFGKPAAKLDLAESSMLAGLPKAPNTYSPLHNWPGAKKRQRVVLNRMVEVGMITRAEADRAAQAKLTFKPGGLKTGNAPYFINEVIKYITSKYEDGAKMLFTEGLSVYTTLDLEMQKAADASFAGVLAGRNPSLEGALVAIDPASGYIKAMVGGRDFTRSNFNRAVQARRQPGSAFKPFLYTATVDQGYTQGSIFVCEPVEFPQDGGPVYRPTDYGPDPYHYRPFTLREALAISDNIVAVRLAGAVGPPVVVDYARKMGLHSELRPYLSLALGTSEVTPLEITGAYCTLAAQGIKTEPLMVTKIADRDGFVIEENRPYRERVIPGATAYLVTDMLTGVLQPGGTAASLSAVLSRPAAGKTGTTQDYRDAWFIGYTPDLVCGVYVGYDSPAKPVGSPGGQIAGPIWANFMAQVLRNKAPREFPVPPGIVQVLICPDSGLLATPDSPDALPASFIQGTEPKQFCSLHSYFGLEGVFPY